MNLLRQLEQRKLSRRGFMAGIGTGLGATTAAALVAGCGGGGNDTVPTPPVNPTTYTDVDILNFALNLEYLEAEFYLNAATGTGLSAADAGTGAGTVTGTTGTPVPGLAGTAAGSYLYEIAQDELNHVRTLRAAITASNGTPVSRPNIAFDTGFDDIAKAAGIGTTFTPFDSANDFLIGAFSFEDVGVTAYTGAAPSISSNTILGAAAGIQAVEGYHAAIIRGAILALDYANSQTSGSSTTTLQSIANKVSGVRGTLGGGNETTLSNTTPIASTSAGLAYARTFSQVLHIVYASAGAAGVTSGGFFPNGLNGNITATTA